MGILETKIVNDKREIFGWAMYDWGNSAFSTTVGTVFLAPYIANLAAEAAKADFFAKTGTAWSAALNPALLANFFRYFNCPRFFYGVLHFNLCLSTGISIADAGRNC